MTEEWFFLLALDLSVEIFEITSHMNLLASGSIPLEGSSRKMMGGLPSKATATESFLLFPPDKVPESLSSYYVRFISVIFLVIAASFCDLKSDFKS